MDWKGLLGANVRRFRVDCGLTQEQLAHDAEIDLSYLSGIERGKRNPSLEVIARISGVLGREPAELVARRRAP